MYCLPTCATVRHLLNCVRRYSLLLLLLFFLFSFAFFAFSFLLSPRRLHLILLHVGKTLLFARSSAGESLLPRRRTTENKVFLRFPVLPSRSLTSRHFRVEYTRERRDSISAKAKSAREKKKDSISLSFCLSRDRLPIKRSSMSVGLLNG